MRNNWLWMLKTTAGTLALAGMLNTGCGFKNDKTGASGGSAPTADSGGGSGAGTGSNVAGGGGSTPTSSPSATPTGGAPAAATYTQVYQQILQPKCLSCHGSGGSPNFSSYGSFAGDTSVVVPGNPEQSALYTATQSGNMPRGGTPLSQSELQMVYSWIEAGAQNN